MPHQTNKGQHLDDKKNTLIKIEGGGLAPGEQNMATDRFNFAQEFVSRGKRKDSLNHPKVTIAPNHHVHSAMRQPKATLINVKMYFAAFNAQRDN